MSVASHLRRFARACAVLIAGAAALAAVPASAALNVGNGVDPANPAPICPSGGAAIIDAFTMDATPADTVSQLNIQLSPPGSYLLLSEVDITANDGVTILSSVVPRADYIPLVLKSWIPVGAAPTGYKIRVVPRRHSEMPAAPGANFSITATVRSANSYSATKTFNDTTSATITIDNLAPGDITWSGVVPNVLPGQPTARITLSWSAATNVVVLRRMGAPVSETLSDGVTYTVGASTFGTGATATQIAAVGNVAGFDDTTGLVNGKAYYYKVFSQDACGNYSSGTTVGPVVPGSMSEGALAGYGPVVGILNPEPGPITVPFRVQARVFSPRSAGGAVQPVDTNVFLTVSDGTTSADVQLVRNPNYGGDTESGIFEIGPLGAGNVSPGLTPASLPGFSGNVGRYTLQVRASNDGRATYVYSAIVGVTATGVRGDGNLLVRDNSSQLCADCHNLQTHSSEATGTAKGSWYVGCRGCHAPHNTTNASLIREVVQPPGVNGQQPPSKVVYSNKSGYYAGDVAANPGSASFANAGTGTTRRTGICQVCHTRTQHYRFDGTDTSSTGTHYTTTCTNCHPHAAGMKGAGGCTSCHGDQNRIGYAVEAPPKDTCGNLTATGGTGINRVGAHATHLTGKSFTAGIACSNCHIDPPNRAGHPGALCTDGADRAVMTWGAIATGSVDPWSGAVVPQWNPTTQSCSANYCHGNFKSSGKAAATVTWGGTVACGDCHEAPPTATHAVGDTVCADCHGAGYALAGISGAALTTHVDGKLDISGTGCTMCHGDNTRTLLTGVEVLDNRYQAAPPRQATGIAGLPATQAHLQHVYNPTTRLPLLCDDCHTPTPTSTAHKNSVLDFGWSALARGASAQVIYSGSPGFTCSASYCHGDNWAAGGPIRGALPIPAWNVVDGSYKACSACHKQAPTDPVHMSLTSRAGGGNTPTTGCNPCHPATVKVDGTIDLAGAKHINAAVETSLTCTSCHATPPTAVAGLANANNANGVGNHASHSVLASMVTRSSAYACTVCHPNVVSNLHATGTVDMIAGVNWSAGAANCSATWCHGATAAQSGWGGVRTVPAWNDATDNYRTCNACHGAPPPLATSGHPGNTTCTDCHKAGATVSAMTGLAAASHVDGTVDTNRAGCTACHGDYAANNVGATGVGADRAAAPGFNATSRDTMGTTLAAAPGVGAHLKHLTGTTLKQVNGGFASVCADCHVVPAAGNKAHATGVAGHGEGSRATIDFSNVAKTGLASGGTALASAYSGSTSGTTAVGVAGTCSNVYCHGGKYDTDVTGKKGTAVRPSWTAVGTMNCGSCHASPPGDVNHGSVISGAKNCQLCHGGSYNCVVTVAGNYTACTAVDPAWHIDGVVELGGSGGCTACHGQPPVSVATSADPKYGNTGIGAHDPHINGSTLIAYGTFTCAACHGSVPVNTAHVDGTVEAGWSALATSGMTATPTGGRFTTAWAVTASCTNYCHTPGSAAIFGGTNRAPVWTAGASQAACGTCHGAPPPVNATAGVDHPQNVNCAACHGAGFAVSGGLSAAAKAKHVNGSTVAGFDKPLNGCTACHGVLAGVSGGAVANTDPSVAPGYAGSTAAAVDTWGASAVSSVTVGAHDAHVRPSASLNATSAIACATCHGTLPPAGDIAHANGTIAAGWASLVSSTGITVAPAAFNAAFRTTPSCTNYCHSNAAPLGGTQALAAPSWTSAANLTCTSCHQTTSDNPYSAASTKLSHGHWLHITNAAGGGYYFNCSACHNNVASGQSDLPASATITNPANHVTGQHNVAFNATFNPGSTGYTGGASPTCSNTYCHSNGTSTSAPPANVSIGWLATKTCTSCHGGTATDPVTVGSATQLGGSVAHLNHVRNAGVLGANYKCGDCHKNTVATGTDATLIGTTLHVNRARDVSIANRGTKTSTDTTPTCGATWCHSSGQVYLATPHYEPVGWTSVWSGGVCNKCHGAFTAFDASFGFTASAAGEPNYANGGAGSTAANSHQKHVSSYACNVCHWGSVNGTNNGILGASHTDGAVQVVMSTTVAGTGATYTPGSGVAGSCTASKCHGSGTPTWGGLSLQCSDCHMGTTDTDSFAFGTPAVISSTEWVSVGHGMTSVGLPTIGGTNTPCLYCHDTAVAHDLSANPFRLRGRSQTGGATFDPYASGTMANNVCLNCHGTGSNGVTPGGGTNPLKNGATKVNAYHAGTLHLTNNGGTRCWDCHDPHGDLGNVKMISKTLVQTSSDANSFAATRVNGGSSIVFTGTTTGTNYAGTATGVCNACHTNTKYYRTGGTNGGHMTNAKCSICHQHNQAPGNAFAQLTACNACHGDAPTIGKHAAHDETTFNSVSYTDRNRHGSATQYGFACNTCHNGTHWDSNNPFTVQVAFNGFDAASPVSVTGTYTRQGAQQTDVFTNSEGSLTYGWYNGSCGSVYCHSNGAPVGTNRVNFFASPSWNETAWTAANKCTKCHAMTAADPSAASSTLSTGHRIHINTAAGAGYFYACQTCHNTVAQGASDYPTTAGTIVNKSNHVSGTHNLSFSPNYNPTTASYNQGPAYTCANTYCHSNGTSTSSVPANTSIAWTATKTCSSCHGGTATDPATVGSSTQLGGSTAHLNHVRNAALLGANYKCGDCHQATVAAGTDATLISTALHVNRLKNISIANRGAKTSTDTTTTCSNTWCHSTGQVWLASPSYEPVGWTSVWSGGVCNKCHGAFTRFDAQFAFTASTSGEPNYANGGAGTTTANSHEAHVATYACAVCHVGSVNATGTAILGTSHTDGAVQVLLSTTVAGASAAYVAGSGVAGSCNSVSCHGNVSVTWGASLDCSGCHAKGTGIAVKDSIDDYVYGNGTVALIDLDAWNTYGHGRLSSAGVYPDSGNPAAGFDNTSGAASSDDGCKYCHNSAVGHNVATNPYRLANIGAGNTATDKVGVCTVCHGGAGYLGKTSISPINATHYGIDHNVGGGGLGGQLCWDCHNPHGDYNYAAGQVLAYMINENPVMTHADATGTSAWGLPTAASNFAPVPDFRKNAGGSGTAWDWADYVRSTLSSGTYRGVCQVCHTKSTNVTFTQTVFTANHNTGQTCVTCHLHDQPPASAFAPQGGDCVGCHDKQQPINAVASGLVGGNRRPVALEFAMSWSHKRSGGKTATKWDCIVCHMEGDSTGSTTADHKNGTVDLRDPDTGTTILNVSFGGGGTNGAVTAGFYSSIAGSYARFNRFSRNLSSATLEKETVSIMINQCLKCHDANGAASPLAQVPGGSAAKPFGTTITGAAYVASLTALGTQGGVVNVDASFTTTNASYHPIKGAQNNWYAKLTRMMPPWNAATRGATANTTSWGARITCWDCHAPTGQFGTITSTVTAHGGPVTVRGSVWTAVTPPALSLCTTCHGVAASGSQTHNTGSAWQTTGNGTPGNSARTSCYICHSSSVRTPVRPIRGQDAHGFDAMSPSTTTGLVTDPAWPQGTTNTYRPFAFMRSIAASGGLWSTTSWKPLSGPGVTTGAATCGGNASFSNASCNDNHSAYLPGGMY